MDDQRQKRFGSVVMTFDDDLEMSPSRNLKLAGGSKVTFAALSSAAAPSTPTRQRSRSHFSPSKTPAPDNERSYMYSDDEDGLPTGNSGASPNTVRFGSQAEQDFHIKVEDRATPEADRVVHFRKNGDREAQRRTISAKHDTYDQMIIQMKESGYNNKEIVDRVKNASGGAVDYDHKTIATRYARLKQAEADEYDRMLDEELTDWHEGEDEALLQADEMALAEIRAEIERKRARRWEYTAKNLQKLLRKEQSYPAEACQKRFIALQNDKARIPLELDDDPEKRLCEKNQRLLASLQRKQVREDAANDAKERKRLAADQKRIEDIQRKQANNDRQRQRLEARNAVELARANKRIVKVEEQRRQRAAENAEIERLQRGIASGISSTAATPLKTPKKSTPRQGRTPASQNPLGAENARQKLTVEELQNLCVQRGLSKAGNKSQLLNKIDADDTGLSDLSLHTMLAERGCVTDGTREERLKKLAMADASQSNWAKKNRFTPSARGKREKRPASKAALAERGSSPKRFMSEALNVAVIAEEANLESEVDAESADDADGEEDEGVGAESEYEE